MTNSGQYIKRISVTQIAREVMRIEGGDTVTVDRKIFRS